MSHPGHIEVADEFGGPGERPKMTALPDGFPSNSPVTQRDPDNTSRCHAQGDNSHAYADELKSWFNRSHKQRPSRKLSARHPTSTRATDGTF
jgi:hypothetical protein